MDPLDASPSLDLRWGSFFILLWFRRTWVVQEALLALGTVVVWDDVVFNWRAIKVFANVPGHLIRLGDKAPENTFLQGLADRFNEGHYSKPLVTDSFQVTWPIPWKGKGWGDHRFRALKGDMEQVTSSNLQQLEYPQSRAARTPFGMLEQSAILDSRDPRDKLFALRELFDRDPPQGTAVNYNKAPFRVFLDLTWYLISHGVFDILSLA